MNISNKQEKLFSSGRLELAWAHLIVKADNYRCWWEVFQKSVFLFAPLSSQVWQAPVDWDQVAHVSGCGFVGDGFHDLLYGNVGEDVDGGVDEGKDNDFDDQQGRP